MDDYPKSLTREEMINWIDKEELPLYMGATQISKNIVVLRKMNSEDYELTEQEKIRLREAIKK